MIFNSPVYPIPPSYNKDGEMELIPTDNYIKYLENKGAKHIMSTAGTSQFNLLDKDEIRAFNNTLTSFRGNVILGIPALSLKHTLEEIKYFNARRLKNVSFLILFPERYYTDEQIVGFFEKVCEVSDYPVLAHGNPLKRGNGGIYEYDYELLKELSKINGFIGIKEESSTIDYSIKNIGDLDLEIIVAGGSMRRFWCLEPFGATTYLAGIGSFNPLIEEDFYKSYSSKDFDRSKKIMVEIERPIFKDFMTIGWHSCMRESLKQMGYIKNDREPFVKITDKDIQIIKKNLNNIL